MSKNRGFGLLAVVVLAAVLGVGVTLVGSYVSAYNYGNRAEKEIQAQHTNLQNILGQYSLKVSEAVQVPEMYKNDLKEVVTAAIQGRYGENGSQATWQWIREQNLGVDVSVYKQIQQLIEAGRDKFENAQTKFIDVKRGYETNLGYLVRGTFLSVAGYPRIDLAALTIVTSQHAVDTFETGLDTGLKLR